MDLCELYMNDGVIRKEESINDPLRLENNQNTCSPEKSGQHNAQRHILWLPWIRFEDHYVVLRDLLLSL